MFKAKGLMIYCKVYKIYGSKKYDNNIKNSLGVNGNILYVFITFI